MSQENKVDGAVESPFVDQPEFDYNKQRKDTTMPALVEIFEIFGRNAKKLAYDEDNMAQVEDDFAAVQKEVTEVLVKYNVNRADMTYLFQKLGNIPTIIQNSIAKELNFHEREILSRFVGAKNPGTSKFDIDSSNIADIFAAVVKSREQTGGNVFDYHFETPKGEVSNEEKQHGQEN